MSKRRGLKSISNVAQGLLDFLNDLAQQRIKEQRYSGEANVKQSNAVAEGILTLRDQGLSRLINDDMMHVASDEYLFANTPLPMDVNSRMQRASEMGFDLETFYRGTPADMDYERTSDQWSSNNPDVAATYATLEAMGHVGVPYKRGAVITPMLTRKGSAAVVDAKGNLFNQIPDQSLVDAGLADEVFHKGGTMITDSVHSMAKRKGFDGTEFLNIIDRGPQPLTKNVAGTTPSGEARIKVKPDLDAQKSTRQPSTVRASRAGDTRSIFARFDPEFSHLKNLTAAGMPVSVGLSYLLNDPDTTEKEIEQYLAEVKG